MHLSQVGETGSSEVMDSVAVEVSAGGEDEQVGACFWKSVVNDYQLRVRVEGRVAMMSAVDGCGVFGRVTRESSQDGLEIDGLAKLVHGLLFCDLREVGVVGGKGYGATR